MWVEAEPLANIRDMDVKRFVWKNIAAWFGVSKILILDNGLQFDSKAFQRYCLELGINDRYLTLSYSQSNGQAEATNKSIVNGLKSRLNDLKGRWTEELLSGCGRIELLRDTLLEKHLSQCLMMQTCDPHRERAANLTDRGISCRKRTTNYFAII